MLSINEQSHTATLISSLDKIYREAKMNGRLRSRDLYILHIIYKLLGCHFSLTTKQENYLISLYNKIAYSSNHICFVQPTKFYTTTNITHFVQAESNDFNTYPMNNKIIYWQEESSITTSSDLVDTVSDTGFLEGKLSDTYPNFEIGKNIIYNNVGRICFLALESNTLNYEIKDALGNNITHTFTITLIPEINSTLMVSQNIYSHGTINFKIKKL